VDTTRYLGHFFAVALRAPHLRCLMLGDGFGALERLAAFLTTILVGGHVSSPHARATFRGLVSPMLDIVGLHSRLVLNSLIVLQELGCDAVDQVGGHMIEGSRLQVPDPDKDFEIGN